MLEPRNADALRAKVLITEVKSLPFKYACYCGSCVMKFCSEMVEDHPHLASSLLNDYFYF